MYDKHCHSISQQSNRADRESLDADTAAEKPDKQQSKYSQDTYDNDGLNEG